MLQIQSRLRLWQLISPALPVGAYAYSQGLETAVENGWVNSESSLYDWLKGVMYRSLAHLDVPIAIRLHAAFAANDKQAIEYWNDYLFACRETAELRFEDNQQAQALVKLLTGLGVETAGAWQGRSNLTYLTMLNLAAVTWSIDSQELIAGYLWSWCEKQVSAAIKLVPLGQLSGQKVLSDMMAAIPVTISRGIECDDTQIAGSIPGLAIASACHETQYTRLFRS